MYKYKILILFITIGLISFGIYSCTYSPRYTSQNVIYGVASHYGHNDGFHGKRTANGDIYDQNKFTAAHKTLPLNTRIKVTNLDLRNRPTVILQVNDRGPYIDGRDLDCSTAAAKKLGFFNQGTANIKIEILEMGDNKYEKK